MSFKRSACISFSTILNFQWSAFGKSTNFFLRSYAIRTSTHNSSVFSTSQSVTNTMPILLGESQFRRPHRERMRQYIPYIHEIGNIWARLC